MSPRSPRSASKLRICLVSPGHLGSNPRLVKEADALQEAGHDVHVIYGETYAPVLPRDREILDRAEWSHETVSLIRVPWLGYPRRAMHRLWRELFAKGWRFSWIAERAAHPLAPALKARASCVKADLYIGHCIAALPAVVKAARLHGATAGFDAEDYHSGECAEQGIGAVLNAASRILEKHFLPCCRHLTAASPLIAEAYHADLGIVMEPILNVFPLPRGERASNPSRKPADQDGKPSFYWFSQLTGAGRGLEEFLEILKCLQRSVRFDLRGEVSDDYRKGLLSQVEGSGVELRFLQPDLPGTMVSNCAGYTFGVGLELSTPRNRDLCLTNKAFTYLLAGLPVILSRTSAQDLLARELGDAALLIDLNDPEESSYRILRRLQDPDLMSWSGAKALKLGRDRFCWEVEKRKLLDAMIGLIEIEKKESDQG